MACSAQLILFPQSTLLCMVFTEGEEFLQLFYSFPLALPSHHLPSHPSLPFFWL